MQGVRALAGGMPGAWLARGAGAGLALGTGGRGAFGAACRERSIQLLIGTAGAASCQLPPAQPLITAAIALPAPARPAPALPSAAPVRVGTGQQPPDPPRAAASSRESCGASSGGAPRAAPAPQPPVPCLPRGCHQLHVPPGAMEPCPEAVGFLLRWRGVSDPREGNFPLPPGTRAQPGSRRGLGAPGGQGTSVPRLPEPSSTALLAGSRVALVALGGQGQPQGSSAEDRVLQPRGCPGFTCLLERSSGSVIRRSNPSRGCWVILICQGGRQHEAPVPRPRGSQRTAAPALL